MIDNRRLDYYHIKWAQEVKKRDNYTCQLCGVRGGELHAHHLNSYDIYIADRYIISNGTTLCRVCHLDRFHAVYNSGNNTALQFEEFRLIYQAMRNEAEKISIVERATNEVLDELEPKEEVDPKLLSDIEAAVLKDMEKKD